MKNKTTKYTMLYYRAIYLYIILCCIYTLCGILYCQYCLSFGCDVYFGMMFVVCLYYLCHIIIIIISQQAKKKNINHIKSINSRDRLHDFFPCYRRPNILVSMYILFANCVSFILCIYILFFY